jgi:hypothetical protein
VEAVNLEVARALNAQPIGRFVYDALHQLLRLDGHLFEVDANERTFTHRLAMYMQQSLPTWHVDCEYNRDDHQPKELMLPGGDPDGYDTNAQTVYPDIIVHQRGSSNNLLVIEVKKTSSRVSDDKDFLKLREFKSQLGYRFALFVELAVAPRDPGVSRIEWVL